MPYNRPGPGVYVTNDTEGTLTHGQPVQQSGFVGVAVKQKTRSWKDGYDVQKLIDNNEDYYVITKGTVEVDTPAGRPGKGDPVYIDDSNNLTASSSGQGALKYGLVVSVAGERGTPTGKVRIDLDLKSAWEAS